MQIKKPQKMDYFKEREPVQDWEKNYIRELSRFRKALRKNRDKGGENTYDFTDAMSKRRNRAALALLPEILERYKNVLDDEIALGEAWRDLNLPFQTYSIIDAQSHMLLAAAIWILDQVVDQFEGGEPEEGFPEFWTGWRKIYCYLPTDEDQLDDLISCDVWDPQYDYDLIISVEYVLHCRDEEEKDGGGYPRVLTSDRLAAGKTDRETQGRKNFQAILNLIPQDAIDTAVSHFRTAYWQWLDRYFESVEPFLSTSISCENELLELQKQYNDLGTELGVIIDAGEKAAKEEKKKKKLPLAQPIPNFPFSSDFSLSDRPFERNMPGREHAQSAAVEIMATGLEVAAQLDSIADEVDELMDHVNDIRRELRVYGMTMSRMGRIIDDSPEGNIIPTSKMAPMQFENPYELCFALLYLIETDDDMPWCYGAGCGLMSEVCESLPWGVYEYDEFEDEVLYSSDYTADSSDDGEELPADGEPEEDLEGEAEKAEEEPAEEKPVEMPDWYERRYESPDDYFPRSLAQILYEETGCILPRDLHRYDVKAKMLREYGVKDEDGILTMMTSLASARRSHEPLNFRDYHRLNPGKKEEKEDNSEDLKKEIKRLRDALHDAEKASRDAKRELEKAQSEARLEHRELADLRELVFNRENVEEEAPEQGEFEKYIVSQRTVVFGGHDSWVKAIKPLLDGEIRFIDKDLVFDVNIIRNADVLWIQPNAMSHKMYYRIVDNARLYKKPVRYFTYASAVKCAEQVAEGDT